MRNWIAGLLIFLTASTSFASADRFLNGQYILNGLGVLTLPTSTDTLVGRATTDVFTNKSIDGTTNTLSNISGSELAAGAAVANIGYTPLNKAGDTMSGNLNMGGNVISNLSATPQANGAAVLDGSGKVYAAELPSTVMEYQGAWDASTNTPTLADSGCLTATNGNVYRVSVAGTQDLGSGSVTYQVGDFAICTSSLGKWQDSPAADGVVSVNGMQGVVTITASSINAAASGANSDITSLSGLTTPLSVPQGGSGAATFTANGMLYGNGTSAFGVTAAGSQYAVFQAGASGVPTVGSIHLDQAAAVGSSVLGAANGGTGQNSLTLHNVILGNGTSGVLFVAPGTSGNILTSNGTTWVSSSPSVSSPSLNGGSGSPESVTAVGGVTLTSIGYTNYVWLVGHSGAVTVTATPSVTACTSDGQETWFIGTDDTDTVTLQDQANLASSGLSFNGNYVAKKDSVLGAHCDVTQGLWVEDFRR